MSCFSCRWTTQQVRTQDSVKLEMMPFDTKTVRNSTSTSTCTSCETTVNDSLHSNLLGRVGVAHLYAVSQGQNGVTIGHSQRDMAKLTSFQVHRIRSFTHSLTNRTDTAFVGFAGASHNPTSTLDKSFNINGHFYSWALF